MYKYFIWECNIEYHKISIVKTKNLSKIYPL